MTRSPLVLLLLALTACTASNGAALSSRPPPSPLRKLGAVHAPSFPDWLTWLNTDRPLKLNEDLKGRVVLLDFFTYCCINCMHTLPDLAALEERFAGEPFQVIGVHSGKFDEEKDASRIREAIGRYGIHHPVVVDSDFDVWHAYAVSGWPTLVLVDAEGYVVAQASGEPDRAGLERAIAALLKDAKTRGVAAAGPPTFRRPAEADTGPLSYPGKVAALDGGRVAVADSGHHRVLVLKTDGTLVAQVGSGLEGFSDGALDTASFRRPQGIAGRGDVLYVADTENHAIRKVDLKAGLVTTVAGTGRKGTRPQPPDTPPTQTDLRSPWDLAWVGDGLYIAMAGSHQLWRLDTAKPKLEVVAGSGREEILDGKGDEAALAQPSGLASDGKTLFFADSEVSAVRAFDLQSQAVKTLVGEGLFAFGDQDGGAAWARFQHPLGVTLLGGNVYVADTYNNKIRALALAERHVSSVTTDKQALAEPGGLAAVDGRLLVADTNHHRLVWVDPKSGALSPFELKGVTAPAVRGVAERRTAPLGASEVTRLGSGQAAEGEHTLVLTVDLPEGYDFTEGAPTRVRLEVSGANGLAPAGEPTTRQEGRTLVVRAPLRVPGGAGGEVAFDAALYYCGERKSVCLVDRRRLTYALTATAAPTPSETSVHYRPPAAPR